MQALLVLPGLMMGEAEGWEQTKRYAISNGQLCLRLVIDLLLGGVFIAFAHIVGAWLIQVEIYWHVPENGPWFSCKVHHLTINAVHLIRGVAEIGGTFYFLIYHPIREWLDHRKRQERLKRSGEHPPYVQRHPGMDR